MAETRNALAVSLLADLRYALRSLRKSPGFTLAGVLTLGLGIGLNTAIFSLVYGILLRPLDLPRPERLYTVWQNMEARGGPREEGTSRGVFCDWRARNRAFAGMATFLEWPADLNGIEPPESVAGAAVSADYFSVLGVKPFLGRGFLKEEETEGKHLVAVLSHRLWVRRFGGDASIVGQEITVSDLRFTLVGILPEGFRAPLIPQTDVWAPLPLDPVPQDHGYSYVRALGRLKEGVTAEAAQADMDRVASSLAADHPDALRGVGVTLVPVLDSIVAPARKLSLLLFGAVSLVLLIACVNVGNLTLSRATARRAELALLAALGAGRTRLVRQLLWQSLLLALGGALLGVFLGYLGHALLASQAPPQTPRLESVRMDGGVFAYGFAASLAAGLVAGLLPAAWTWRRSLADPLREAAGTTAPRSALRLRSLLVIAQIALSLVLLVEAGLLLRTITALSRVDPGFRTENLVLGHVSLSPAQSSNPRQMSDFLSKIEERLTAWPGIVAAGVVSTLPLADGLSEMSFVLEEPIAGAAAPQTVVYRGTSPGYFKTVGVSLREGRLLRMADTAEAPQVVLVNESFVERFLAGRSPIGRRLRLDTGDPASPWRSIVGVVGDVHGQTLDRPADAEIHVPLAQQPSQRVTVVARAASSPDAALQALQAAVSAVRSGQVVAGKATMEEVIDRSFAPRRFTAILLGAFAAVALVLTAVGIYGVVALAVSQRRPEIAVRMALGASSAQVAAMMLRWCGLLIVSGVLLGLAGSLAAGRALAGLLFGVAPLDGLTLAAASLLLSIIAFGACWMPVRRAARIDPARTLGS
ncbi:MAG TPA: ABC transporter permease [Thermoanaerobaculia bacterium]|nr:ABC transporter permease [Thermoanaerobaculia bacterium]